MTEGSDKETRHFELSLKESGIGYEPGDSLGVLPVNCSEVVSDLLQAVGLSGDESIALGEQSHALEDALSNRLACTVLSKIQIKKFNELAQSEKLENLLKIENKESLIDYMWGRELIDLFLEFPQPGRGSGFCRPSPYHASGLYSIASSLRAHPDEVHLTVAVAPRGSRPQAQRRLLFLLGRAGGGEHSLLPPSEQEFQAARKPRHSDHHGRSGNRDRSLPSLRRGKTGHRGKRKKLVVLR